MGRGVTPAEQLVEALDAKALALRSLGLHFADPHNAVAPSQIERVARQLVAQMRQDDDDHLSAQSAIDIMATLWPDCDPTEVQPGWWTTPLGRLVAKAGGLPDSEALTVTAAAVVLGVTPSAVSQLLTRGRLDRHPDGGVLRSSLMAEIARRHADPS